MRPSILPSNLTQLTPLESALHDQLHLITGDELAAQLRFSGVTSGFRAWCNRCGIKPVPGRRNLYDPKHVRARLDELQGIAPLTVDFQAPPLSLTEQRRARLGKV